MDVPLDFSELQKVINVAFVLFAVLVLLLVVVIAIVSAEAADLRRRLKLAEDSNGKLREMLIEAHAYIAGPLAHEPNSSRGR